MANQFSINNLILLLINGIRTILYFPVWWYSKGLLKILQGAWNWLQSFEQSLGLMIWVKNLFVPMFGQRDLQGRLISFFLRLFQIISKSIILLVFAVFVLVIILLWLFIPVFVIYMIIFHLFL